MNDEKYTIEQLVAGNFVKYKKLRELVSKSYSGSKATKMNVFIDLYSVLKPLYSIDQWGYRYTNPLELSASIINMCGHYRSFFVSYGVYTKYYLIYGLNSPVLNNSFVIGYNNSFIESYNKKQDLNSMVQNNMTVLSMLCQYLPGIYFYDIGTNEVSGMIARILRTLNDPTTESLVISKDIVPLQLIPEYRLAVLRPYKSNNEDCSYIVDNSNMWKCFTGLYRRVNEPVGNINNGFIQNILPMTRVPERNMPSVFNIPKAFSIINKAIQFRFLENDKLYKQSSINTILESLGVGCNPTLLDMRYKAINPTFQGMYILTNSNPEFRTIQFTDVQDKNSLHYILNTYYSNIPIDVDRL